MRGTRIKPHSVAAVSVIPDCKGSILFWKGILHDTKGFDYRRIKTTQQYSISAYGKITDMPFRLICKGYGCGMMYTEMVSAKGLYYGSERTGDLLQVHSTSIP